MFVIKKSRATASSRDTMVLQVLDLVNSASEPFYGDCPAPTTYTDLDLNGSTHTTCTIISSTGTYMYLNFTLKFKFIAAVVNFRIIENDN